jgi:hypothetical protein
MTNSFFADLDVSPSYSQQQSQSSSFFSDLNEADERTKFLELPFEERARISKELGEKASQQARTAVGAGMIPGGGKLLEKAREKGLLEPSLNPTAESVAQFGGEALKIGALGAGVTAATNPILSGIPGAGIAQSALTGATYKGLETIAGEQRLPETPEVVGEAALFGGGHALFQAARKTAQFLKGKEIKPSNLIKSSTDEFYKKQVIKGKLEIPKNRGKTIETAIGEKYGLRPFAGTEIKEPRGITPTISKEQARGIKKEIKQSSENVVKAIVKENIPAAVARERGLDLNKASKDYYDLANNRAQVAKRRVNLLPIVEWMDKEIDSIQKSIPSISDPKNKRLSIIKEERKKFLQPNPEYNEKPSKILDEFGRPMRSPVVPKEMVKKIDARKTLKQYQAYNENVDRLYKKTEMTGLEQAEAKAYHDINDQLVNAMKASGNEAVARPFGYANEIYKQTKNLQLVEKILEDGFRNPNSLKNILKSSKRGYLQKSLGKDAMNQLDEIAKYQTAVSDKMKDFVKIQDPEYLNIRKLWRNIADIPARIAGKGYTGKDINNSYIKFQKKFLAKDYKAAEKEAEEILENLGQKTLEVKPKEISGS